LTRAAKNVRATLGTVPRTPLARISARDALDSAVIALTAAGCDTPRLDAEVLLAAALGVDRAALLADPGRGLEPNEADRFADYARRRRDREPVAYILGVKGFRMLELAVDPRVLIPRPETEHVVEAVLELPTEARVVDVGTGSGAIALALKAERPDLTVLATDASLDALAVARANALRLGLDVDFRQADLLERVDGPLDAVVSNPPYLAERERPALAPEILRYEPAGALFAGPDGLDALRRLVPAAAASGAGFVAFEVGAGQAPTVAAMVRDAGFPAVHAVPDLAGIDRVVVGRRDVGGAAGRRT
jgi:release factor glutamine methyltransferase